MATLAELKTRIILETNKDDLAEGEESADALTTAIDRAIEFHADEAFWFNQDSGTVSTTSGTGYVAKPYAVRVPKVVAYNGCPLQKAPLSSVQHRTDSGLPRQWAAAGSRIYLFPIPDSTYSLSIYGIAQIDAPEDDEDETVWTNEAYDLIAARTRFLLYRDIYRDVEGSQLAAQAEGEALSRLRRESRARGISPLQSTGSEPWAAPNTFDINRG